MIAADGDMLSDWESMTIDEPFALREEMASILSARNRNRNDYGNSARRWKLSVRSEAGLNQPLRHCFREGGLSQLDLLP